MNDDNMLLGTVTSNKLTMNKNIRKILDWIELPRTLFYFIKMKKEDRDKAKDRMNNWTCEWRKNSVSFKIAQWFINIL